MFYGYVDESGSPGVAVNRNDFFVVSMVVFETEDEAMKASQAIDRLRSNLRLKKTYEFHCSRNTNFAQKGMLKLMGRLNFRFMTVALRKTNIKKDASYKLAADLLTEEINAHRRTIKIELDSNPMLAKALKKALNQLGLKCPAREVDSCKSNLIQLADYVVNLSAKYIKGTDKDGAFAAIAKKQLAFRNGRDVVKQ